MGSGIPGLAAIAGMAAAPNHPTPAIAGMRWDECGATFEALVVGSVVANDAMGAPGDTRLQLRWVRTQPRTTFHGTMGWALANDGLGVRRIHVCAHSPCTHSQSAWAGVFAELPSHVRRVGAPRLGRRSRRGGTGGLMIVDPVPRGADGARGKTYMMVCWICGQSRALIVCLQKLL